MPSTTSPSPANNLPHYLIGFVAHLNISLHDQRNLRRLSSTLITVGFNKEAYRDAEEIVNDLSGQMRALDNGNPSKRDFLLRFSSLHDAFMAWKAPRPYFHFRRASRSECRRANVEFELMPANGEVSAFHFYETFGIRLTLLLNFNKSSGTVVSLRRISTGREDAADCITIAASRMNMS